MDGILEKNWLEIQAQLTAFNQSHADRIPVRLLAVSKTQSPEKIHQLASLGQKHFAENYLQEALAKIDELSHLKLEWHYIGRIQSKKIPQIVERFAWIDSVSRFTELNKIEEHSIKTQVRPKVLLQVNIANEASKQGFSSEELLKFTEELLSFQALDLRGLMVFPPQVDSEERARFWFGQARSLFERLQADLGPQFDRLSMGTSGDYLLAMEFGATDIRVGERLFGPRS